MSGDAADSAATASPAPIARNIDATEPAQGSGLFLFWGPGSALLTCLQVRLPARVGATMARLRAISGPVPKRGTNQTPEAGDQIAPTYDEYFPVTRRRGSSSRSSGR